MSNQSRSANRSSNSNSSQNRTGIAVAKTINNREAIKHNFDTKSGSSMETHIISVPPPQRLVDLLNQLYDIPS